MNSQNRDFTIREDASGHPLGSFPSLSAELGIVHAVTPKGGWLLPADLLDPGHAPLARSLARSLGLEDAAWLKQVHGNRIVEAESPGLLGEGDAMISSKPGLGLIMRGADCPLILAWARGSRDELVGAAHASWRGTVAKVAERMILTLLERSGADPPSLRAVIAPSAGPCCYEVGEEVRERALDELGPAATEFFENRHGALYFDLWKANRAQLENLGLASGRVDTAGHCTMCMTDRYPSWRKEGRSAGRMAALIGLLPLSEA